MELIPQTEPGSRLVELLERHAETFRERAGEHDRNATFPAENFALLKEGGALRAFVPESLGGLGLESVRDWAIAIERLARADGSTAIALNMHLSVSRNIANLWSAAVRGGDDGPARQYERQLRAISAGDQIICAPVSERGTDFLRPRTTATESGNGYVIDGHKIMATMSPIANLLAIHAKIAVEGSDRICFVFVPMDAEGVVLEDDWDALGMRGSGSQSVAFRNCEVPAEALQIGGRYGRWSSGLLMGRTLGNLTLVAAFLGIAERAREIAVETALERTKTRVGGFVGQSSGVQHRLGEIDIDLAAARAILDRSAERVDQVIAEYASSRIPLEIGHACMRDYQCAKWVVNQNAIQIVSCAMDVCGGSAFMSDHELSRLYRDVRAGPFMQPFSPSEAREYIGQIAIGAYPES